MNGTARKVLLLLLSLLGYFKGFNGNDYSEVDYLLNETELEKLDGNETDISYGYVFDSDINEIHNSSNNERKNNINNRKKNNTVVSTLDPEVNYSLNETLAPQQDEKATESLYDYVFTSSIKENNNSSNNTSDILIKNDNFDVSPLDPLIKIALIALMLHILIIGGGFVIYIIVCCSQCSVCRRNRPIEVTHRMQSPLTLKHVPNTTNCPCHGCRVARQILNGLIVQKILAERAEC